jgi:ferredoxin
LLLKIYVNMKRQIVKIDRDLCNGCEECIPNCHEGALQMIDGKATLISDLLCDGLGACIGHCPVGAITIEEREAAPYNEVAALQEMIPQGRNVVIAHLKHLRDHQQHQFIAEAAAYLRDHKGQIDFDPEEILSAVEITENPKQKIIPIMHHDHAHHGGGCPGSRPMSFQSGRGNQTPDNSFRPGSALTQWPVQMHLINPNAPYFHRADLLLAADCVAFSLGDFHQSWLEGKKLCILCPKLDSEMHIYVDKLVHLIREANLNTITVMKMQVPCCGGILQMAQKARETAGRNIPVKSVTVGIQGEILLEEWI